MAFSWLEVTLPTECWLYKVGHSRMSTLVVCMMSKGLHILGFQNKLKTERNFLKSLLCQNVSKRKLILERSSSKQLRLIQTLLCLILRGEIGVSHHLLNKIKRSKKLSFIEQRFKKIAPDPNLKQHLLSLVHLLPSLVRLTLKKK